MLTFELAQSTSQTSHLSAASALLAPRYMSAVTPYAAALGKMPELLQAKERLVAGQPLPQRCARYAGADEIDSALREMDDTIRPHIDAMRRAAAKHTNKAQQLTAIIKKASIQTSATRFEDPEAMADFNRRLQETIALGEPVVMAMPEGGGKAPVSLKTGRGTHPDFAEFLSLKMRAALVTVLREFYQGGAHMIVVPDAPLHTDLGWEPASVMNFIMQLWRDLPRLGINNEVLVAYTPDWLPPDWLNVLSEGALEVQKRAAQNPEVLAGMVEQARSLIYIKKGDWKNEEHAALAYAAIAGASDVPESAMELAKHLADEAWKSTALYTAINHYGIYGRRLIERIVAGLGFSSDRYLRCSVHAKPGSPRLALSVQNSMAPPGLLPMHSIGLRMTGKEKTRWGLVFDIVARMRGWTAVHEAETGRFMYYEGAV